MKDRNFVGRVLSLPRIAKRLVVLIVDAIICIISVLIAFYLRLGEWVTIDGVVPYVIIASVAISLPLFIVFGLYRAIFRYAGWSAVTTIAQAVIVYLIPFSAIFTYVGVEGVPRTVGIIQPLLLFLFISASRVFARAWFGDAYKISWKRSDLPRVLIYGAGGAGRQLASAIRSSNEMKLVGFLDDKPDLWRSTIDGLKVFDPRSLSAIVPRHRITDILLAVPSATRARRAEIVAHLKSENIHIRTLPALIDIARGKLSVGDLKELEIEDLLGRPPIAPDQYLLRRNITGKVVLVSGAGGSIGSELCRQIAAIGPSALLLMDSSEYALYLIHQELTRISLNDEENNFTVVPLLASAGDETRAIEIISNWRPDTIYHAAAYKHVPLVEQNAIEGIRNNVFGTLIMAKIAHDFSVPNFVLISTDKAVRPTNVMGTTKRLSEMILQSMHMEGSPTCFSMVRFGNVLGSSGSVVPLFRQQIAAGGPVTITHSDINRYFMTIPEAAQLVLQAGAMAQGGEVFVLDMGEPVKIVDLARNMIELSGLTIKDENNEEGDIEIKIIGLRPGEKLYEELLIGDDPQPSSHPRIWKANEQFIPWSKLGVLLDKLKRVLDANDAATARALLRQIVPEYQPNPIDTGVRGSVETLPRN